MTKTRKYQKKFYRKSFKKQFDMKGNVLYHLFVILIDTANVQYLIIIIFCYYFLGKRSTKIYKSNIIAKITNIGFRMHSQQKMWFRNYIAKLP